MSRFGLTWTEAQALRQWELSALAEVAHDQDIMRRNAERAR